VIVEKLLKSYFWSSICSESAGCKTYEAAKNAVYFS